MILDIKMESKNNGEKSMKLEEEEEEDPRVNIEIADMLMGKRLFPFKRGCIGHVLTPIKRQRYSDTFFSPIVVKQNGRDSGNNLSKEYQIANFLGNNIPFFVPAPFGFMRGFTIRDGYRFNEKPSLIQQQIRGSTFFDFSNTTFTLRELCYLFLQSNEFYLRVGDTLMMQDANPGNVMVETRFREQGVLPHIKFIDFGFWIENYDHRWSGVMLSNMKGSVPMCYCMEFMGFTEANFNALWRTQNQNISVLHELPGRLEDIFSQMPDKTLGNEIIQSEQFSVVKKLYSVRHLQSTQNIPMDMISTVTGLHNSL